jgi:cysteinyl-tRNA synthetase
VLRLFDTATATVRPLELRDPGSVGMYVCGLTVYDLPHLGHGRLALVYDVLRRYLLFCGLDVRFISNITDIDDNIIGRALRESRTEAEVATQYEAEWWKATDALGVLRPTVVPHATDYVPQMVELVAALVQRDAAYVTDDGVYFSVSRVSDYGRLAHQPLESLRAGARVDPGDQKRSPLDFALWKSAKPGEPSWDSPWGPGRPGWHTECVVMSLGLLGDDFDLHGGGRDLAFPHHENERAQAVAQHRRFARHWVHNGWVEVAGEKMSKSLGNFSTLPDLLGRHDPRSYRLLVLRAHYRSPMEVTPDTIEQAERSLERLDSLARRYPVPDPFDADGVVVGAGADLDPDARARFGELMDDDLQTSEVLADLFDLVNRANRAADSGDEALARRLATTVVVLCGALGLHLRTGGEVQVDAAAAGLVRERDAARAVRQWDRADELRVRLEDLGWTVEDGPAGTRLRR